MPNPSYVKLDPEALLRKLETEYGPLAFFTSKGEVKQLNERFFAELIAYELSIIHEADEERFYVYNSVNGLLEVKSVHALKKLLSDRIRQAGQELSRYSGICRLDSEHARRDIVSLLRGVVDKRGFFVNRPVALHCQNTMLIWENGVFIPKKFSADFRSRNQLNVAYDPDAWAPRFLKELISPALSEDDRQLVRKMFGLFVLGRNLPQRFFILIGPANTGKSTLCLVAQGLIGEHNCAELRTAQLEGRFEMARFVGKTLIYGADVAANFLMTEAAYRLKCIIGGDPLVGERKNSNEDFRFHGDKNAFVTTNVRLLMRMHGDLDVTAWRRRIVSVIFKREPPARRIADFDRFLIETEGSGILNYSLQGLRDYYRDDASIGDIVLSSEQHEPLEDGKPGVVCMLYGSKFAFSILVDVGIG